MLVEETRILAIGDFGVGGASQRNLGAAVRRFEAHNRAQVLLALGDNDYTENPAAFRSNWDESFGWARGGACASPASSATTTCESTVAVMSSPGSGCVAGTTA